GQKRGQDMEGFNGFVTDGPRFAKCLRKYLVNDEAYGPVTQFAVRVKQPGSPGRCRRRRSGSYRFRLGSDVSSVGSRWFRRY
ncbi:MAG: hypothetical protein L0191_19360, partial [Acidobacteria bacterium]|nr:hypothetical protein [Acidobacteriota bacterium]